MKSCDWEGIVGGCLGYLTITSIPHTARIFNIFSFFSKNLGRHIGMPLKYKDRILIVTKTIKIYNKCYFFTLHSFSDATWPINTDIDLI